MADMNQLGATVSSQFRGLSGRHPGQWPLLPRLLCAIGVFVAILVAGWFVIYSDQLDQLDAGQQAEVKLREEFKTKVGQANSLEALKEQKAQVAEYVQTLEKALPSKSEMDKLLDDITHAGTGHNLQFDLFRPDTPVVRDYYAEQPISIRVSGAYHDLALFSSDIANLTRIVTLNNLSVGAAKDGTLTLETVAKTFRYLDPDEVQAQKGGKGGKKK
ncbi:MAG: type 4a pilus biogenesis protein PilO [Burkholderiaceae bacterium]|nr:type 4a pilus biogenesis protein PilO [Burkholderiaceae bacterium]